MVSRCEHGNLPRSFRRCEMTGFQKTKGGGLVSASFQLCGSPRLDLPQPAVDGDLCARDEGRILRCEERHSSGDLLWLSDSLHRHHGNKALSISSIVSLESPVRANPAGVSIGPGLTAFTRMPRSTSSAAIDRVNERSAAFVAAYAVPFGTPISPATEVFTMIEAPSLR